MTEKSIPWPHGVAAITLFTEQLEEPKALYERVFDLRPVFADEHSDAFKFGGTIINLLDTRQADELIAPAKPVRAVEGSRAVYTLQVDDVEATCETLQSRGVTLLNGPIDRLWGIRITSFTDPAKHVWEIAR